MRKITLLIGIVLSNLLSHAQPFDVYFDTTLTWANISGTVKVEDGYFVSAMMTDTNYTYKVIGLAQTNLSGTLVWSTKIHDDSMGLFNGGSNLIVKRNGKEVSMVGYGSGIFNNFGANALVVSVDIVTKEIRKHLFGFGGTSVFFSQLELENGDFFFGGNIINDTTVYNDMFLVKTDSNYNVLWTKSFDFGYAESGLSLYEMPNGTFCISGGGYTSLWDDVLAYRMVNFTSDGQIIWKKLMGDGITQFGTTGPWADYNNDLVFMSGSMNYVNNDISSQSSDASIGLMNMDGELVQELYLETEWEIGWHAFSLRYLGDDEFLFISNVGYNRYDDFDKNYGTIVKANLDGEILWQRYYDFEPPNEKYLDYCSFGERIYVEEDGSILVEAAISKAIYPSQSNVFHQVIRLLKLDANGCLNESYCGDTVVGIREISREEALGEWVQVSPNPSSSQVTIKSLLPVSSGAELLVYSLDGRLAHQQSLSPSEQAITLDVSTYPAGLYIIHLVHANKVIGRQKMVVNE